MSQRFPLNKRQRIGEEADLATQVQKTHHYTDSENQILQQTARILTVAVSDLPLGQDAPRADSIVNSSNTRHVGRAAPELTEPQYQSIPDSGHPDWGSGAVELGPNSLWIRYDESIGFNDSNAPFAFNGCQPMTTANNEFTGSILEANHSAVNAIGPSSSVVGNQSDFHEDPTRTGATGDSSGFGGAASVDKACDPQTLVEPLATSDIDFLTPSLGSGYDTLNSLDLASTSLVLPGNPETHPLPSQFCPAPDFLPNQQYGPDIPFEVDNFGSVDNFEFEAPECLNNSQWSVSSSNFLSSTLQTQQTLEPVRGSQPAPQRPQAETSVARDLGIDLLAGYPYNSDSLGVFNRWERLSQSMSDTLFPDLIMRQGPSGDYPISEQQLVLRGPSPNAISTMASNKTRKRRYEPLSEIAMPNEKGLTPSSSLSTEPHSGASLERTILFTSPTGIRTKEKQGPRVRQPFRDLKKRKETGETRKTGACVRCRMQRIRCSPAAENHEGPCATCVKLSAPTLCKLPCVRFKITDSSLFDKGTHPQFRWSQRWSSWDLVEIDTWASADIKTITITQDVLGGSIFKIRCREFIPREGDSLARTWKKDGAQIYYHRAPYAVLSMKETGNEIRRFVANNIGASIKYYIMEKQDPLLSRTYAMAYAMVFRPNDFAENEEGKRLLQEVFQLWVAIRMESQSERIVGDKTLGMEPQTFDPNVSSYGTNSIPPIMSAQIELMTTTRILQPLKKAVLQRLQRMIQANELRSWLPFYLCLFVLLHSCSILTADEHRQAKKYGLKTRYVFDAFIEELHTGAKTMIYYFHYCNKGSHPFMRNWTSDENLTLANLNGEQAQFLKDSSVLIQEKMPQFKTIRESGDFENDWYFVSQLYDVNWKPTFTV